MKKTIVSVAATTIIASAISSQAFAATYKVEKGDSLWAISTKYGTTVQQLKEMNHLKSDVLHLNQVLTVTKDKKVVKTASVSTTPVKATMAKTYKVKSGDTLGKIASKYKITLAELLTWNKLKSQRIYPGNVLKVSKETTVVKPVKKPTPTPAKPSTKPNISTHSYTVKAGDTLSVLSLQLHMSIADLKKLNNLTSDNIFVGQKLVVGNQNGHVSSTPDQKSDEPKVVFTASKLLAEASKVVGTPYVWAGSDLTGFDCSGFIYYAYNQVGISIPRTSSMGYYSRSYYVKTAQPGDLVFFADTYQNGISHLGIYIGNNQFIHAGDNGVEISSLNNSYWKAHFDGFKRLYEVL